MFKITHVVLLGPTVEVLVIDAMYVSQGDIPRSGGGVLSRLVELFLALGINSRSVFQ